METARAPFIACDDRLSRRRAPARAAGPPQATPEDGLAMPRLRESLVLSDRGAHDGRLSLRGNALRATLGSFVAPKCSSGYVFFALQTAN